MQSTKKNKSAKKESSQCEWIDAVKVNDYYRMLEDKINANEEGMEMSC